MDREKLKDFFWLMVFLFAAAFLVIGIGELLTRVDIGTGRTGLDLTPVHKVYNE